jgi:hypothetical protein
LAGVTLEPARLQYIHIALCHCACKVNRKWSASFSSLRSLNMASKVDNKATKQIACGVCFNDGVSRYTNHSIYVTYILLEKLCMLGITASSRFVPHRLNLAESCMPRIWGRISVIKGKSLVMGWSFRINNSSLQHVTPQGRGKKNPKARFR